ncbi:MAG: signal peptidase I [Mailhella sp.]|nr:signal peptidase I [Mailhella sp.]MBQ8744411.1 signal peptidase I [Mailhella sp.]
MSQLSEKNLLSSVREYGEALLWAVAFALIIRTFVVQTFTIPSGSMLQTIQIGDYLLVNKFIYGVKIPFTNSYLFRGEDPQVGDIIVFEYPRDPDTDYIKRVVGVPGDELEMKNKKFYRNGQLVQEDYVQHTSHYMKFDNFGPIKVPADSYFVMGDNRDNSSDSRDWGFVPRSAIHGKAWRFYWSWDSTTNTPRWSRIGDLVE